jgi:plastocyanin
MVENQPFQSPPPAPSRWPIALIVIILIAAGAYALTRRSDAPTTDNNQMAGDQNRIAEGGDESMSDTGGEENIPVNDNPGTTPTPSTPPTNTNGGTTTPAVKSFTVSGKNFSMTPSSLSVNKGDTVKITFKNDGGFHDLVIDGYDVETPQIQTGQTATVEFIADKTGSFEYYCSVGTHRQQGMKGTFTVK